jgi:hypothetical protein
MFFINTSIPEHVALQDVSLGLSISVNIMCLVFLMERDCLFECVSISGMTKIPIRPREYRHASEGAVAGLPTSIQKCFGVQLYSKSLSDKVKRSKKVEEIM